MAPPCACVSGALEAGGAGGIQVPTLSPVYGRGMPPPLTSRGRYSDADPPVSLLAYSGGLMKDCVATQNLPTRLDLSW
jgi:hypothetical protein